MATTQPEATSLRPEPPADEREREPSQAPADILQSLPELAALRQSQDGEPEMLIDMHMLLAPFILILQMHTDMGDERGIRLRCICLGRAAPRGSRMRGMGLCGKGSESRIARSSLSIARSSVCATAPFSLTSPKGSSWSRTR